VKAEPCGLGEVGGPQKILHPHRLGSAH
jgi:hypothetical protein